MAAKKPDTSNTDELLKILVENLSDLNKKIDYIAEINANLLEMQKDFLQSISNKMQPKKIIKTDPDLMSLLSLPSTLRKTVIAIYKLKEATAEDLSGETRRLRAVESASANQLVRLGYLQKKREGRHVYFYI